MRTTADTTLDAQTIREIEVALSYGMTTTEPAPGPIQDMYAQVALEQRVGTKAEKYAESITEHAAALALAQANIARFNDSIAVANQRRAQSIADRTESCSPLLSALDIYMANPGNEAPPAPTAQPVGALAIAAV